MKVAPVTLRVSAVLGTEATEKELIPFGFCHGPQQLW